MLLVFSPLFLHSPSPSGFVIKRGSIVSLALLLLRACFFLLYRSPRTLAARVDCDISLKRERERETGFCPDRARAKEAFSFLLRSSSFSSSSPPPPPVVSVDLFSLHLEPRDNLDTMAATPPGCPVSESNLVDVTHLPRALQWLLAIAVVLISGFFAGERGERREERRGRRGRREIRERRFFFLPLSA